VIVPKLDVNKVGTENIGICKIGEEIKTKF